jgi:hypothetical protein
MIPNCYITEPLLKGKAHMNTFYVGGTKRHQLVLSLFVIFKKK